MAKREFSSLPSGARRSKITTMTATFINHVSVHANDLVRRPHPLERHRLAARNDVFDGATIVQSVNGAALTSIPHEARWWGGSFAVVAAVELEARGRCGGSLLGGRFGGAEGRRDVHVHGLKPPWASRCGWLVASAGSAGRGECA